MKTQLLSVPIALALATSAMAQNENQQSGFGALVGLKAFDLKGTSFSHNTHPDDQFLPNANVSGSAGNTSLDGGAYYASVGLNYVHPFSSVKALSWRIEAGGLFGDNEDRRKNANDNRPDANAAFIYEDSDWGFYGSAGLTYHLGDHFYLGGDVEYNGIFIDNGWDRFNSKQTQEDKLFSIVTGGPAIGYDFNKDFGIEADAQFGDSMFFGFKIRYKF